MMALLLKLFSSRLPMYALAGLVGGGIFLGMHQRIRALTAERDLAIANLRIAQSSADRAYSALRELQTASDKSKADAKEAVKAAADLQVKSAAKVIYIEKTPAPSTCPAAISYLVDHGNQIDGGSK